MPKTCTLHWHRKSAVLIDMQQVTKLAKITIIIKKRLKSVKLHKYFIQLISLWGNASSLWNDSPQLKMAFNKNHDSV